MEKIVKEKGKYKVVGKQNRNLGCYDTLKNAEERLNQVQYFKEKNKKDHFEIPIKKHIEDVEKLYILELIKQVIGFKKEGNGYRIFSKGKSLFEEDVDLIIKEFNKYE